MKNIFVAAIVMVLVMPSTVLADDDTSQLGSDTHYYLAVSQDQRKASRLLAWEGTIQGGITGVIRWWNDTAEAVSPNYVTRWEILDCPLPDPSSCPHDPALTIMAGYSAGTNFAPVDGITKWLGQGLVTFVDPKYPQYAKWFGHRTTEGGSYTKRDRTEGDGVFTIYDTLTKTVVLPASH
ncbi:MAG: hypothetical protein IIA07_04715 [Proteobacteria bacterium]|nr:hypothetical protein [Pseudomonadota bacterium]